jgi:AcrR family transcriptional regulator
MRRERRTTPVGLTWRHEPPGPEHAARAPLTRDEIVDCAIRLLDREGPDAFSMRRLGQELDAGATSLYWHVRSKDELVDLVLDRVIGEVLDDYRAGLPGAADWRARLAEVARSLRRVLLRHRHIAPLLGERPTIGPRALDAAEAVLGILLDAGFDPRTTALASGALINYASGFALLESRSSRAADGTPAARELEAAVMEYFATLPPERYPNMIRVAAERIAEDEQFEYGLARVLDGIEADRGAGAG